MTEISVVKLETELVTDNFGHKLATDFEIDLETKKLVSNFVIDLSVANSSLGYWSKFIAGAFKLVAK